MLLIVLLCTELLNWVKKHAEDIKKQNSKRPNYQLQRSHVHHKVVPGQLPRKVSNISANILHLAVQVAVMKHKVIYSCCLLPKLERPLCCIVQYCCANIVRLGTESLNCTFAGPGEAMALVGAAFS